MSNPTNYTESDWSGYRYQQVNGYIDNALTEQVLPKLEATDQYHKQWNGDRGCFVIQLFHYRKDLEASVIPAPEQDLKSTVDTLTQLGYQCTVDSNSNEIYITQLTETSS